MNLCKLCICKLHCKDVDLTKERTNYLYFKTYTNHTQIFEFNKSYPIDKAKRLGASAFLML